MDKIWRTFRKNYCPYCNGISLFFNIKTYGLIANDPVSELRDSKINPITPKDYVDNIWNRDREGTKKLKTQDVFNYIANNLEI